MKRSKLIVLYTNADTLTNKQEELILVSDEHKADIIIITEAKPKNSKIQYTAQHFKLPGFTVYSNVETQAGRGIVIYIKEELSNLTTEVTAKVDVNECVWLEIRLMTQRLLLGCIYRSEDKSTDTNNSNMCEMISEMSNRNSTHFVLTGDYNLPEINWDTISTNKPEEHISQKFIDTLRDNYLVQNVTEPTRVRHGQHSNLLDLIITKDENTVTNVSHLPGLGLSDHLCMRFEINIIQSVKSNNKPRKNLNTANYKEMNRIIADVNWGVLLENKTVEQQYKCIYDTIEKASEKCIKLSNKSNKERNKKKLWMNRAAMRKLKRKYSAWKRYCDTEEYTDYVCAQNEKKELSKMTKKLCKDFEHEISKNIKTNPKAFWRYVQSKVKSRSSIPDLKAEDGSELTDAREKAEELNNFFASVLTVEDPTDVPTLNQRHNGNKISTFNITPEMVKNKLSNLNVNKAAGPDGLHPRVLKELASTLSVPLSILFNTSLSSGEVPSMWKVGVITALHKKGSKSTAGNYRPISLTAIICKIMEGIIRDYIVKHMMDHSLFCDAQHGFVPGRSCMTQLLLTLEIWSNHLDAGNPLDCIYLDFRKAFDTVPHLRLLSKLDSYGISGNIKAWISSFLLNRKQRVTVDGAYSDWKDVTSGIPQGSVLGPLMFVVFINDLPDIVASTAKIFADDTKLFRTITSVQDHITLQEDLQKLSEWAAKWSMKFNYDKCKVLHLGKANQRSSYQMDDIILETTSAEKDLGVVIDENLQFTEHVNKAVNKASRMLGLIKTVIKCKDHITVPTLYKSLVRPHLEYGNLVWCPRWKKDQLEIEKVQRRATKMVPSIRDLPYQERLKQLKLPSLHHRRRRGDMIQVFKIMKQVDRLSVEDFFQLSDSGLRGHAYKVYKKKSTTSLRQQSFSRRIINEWNSLPHHVVDSVTVNSFKNNLDKHYGSTMYDLP